MKEETVTIPKQEYNEMLNHIEFLNCLEACGVDNWDGYSDAWEMFDEEMK